MKALVTALFATLTLLSAQSSLAAAAEHANARAHKSRVVHGVALATLCKTCAVVTKERTETRKGQTSGVGAVGGAVAGGVIGNQFGRGNGKTAMTVVGAVGGAVAGNEIEKNVKKTTVWITTVTFKDGSTKTYENSSDPNLRAGDVVKVVNGKLARHGA